MMLFYCLEAILELYFKDKGKKTKENHNLLTKTDPSLIISHVTVIIFSIHIIDVICFLFLSIKGV